MTNYQTLDTEFLCSYPTYKGVWDFIKKAHGNQRRKTTAECSIPYYYHPLKVLELVLNAHQEPFEFLLPQKNKLPLFVPALLHDVMEDTPYNSPLKIAYELKSTVPSEYLDEILDVTAELTNPQDLTAQNKQKWQSEHAAKMSFNAKLVKMADQISNVYDTYKLPTPWDYYKKCTYLQKARSVHDACLIGTENCPQLHGCFKILDEMGRKIYKNAENNFKIQHQENIKLGHLIKDYFQQSR